MLCESSSAVVAGNMAKTVLVYSDKGAGTRSVVTTIQALQRNLHSVNVKPIMAQEVCEGSWKDNSVLLVMPGGADLPYCKALNGVGNGHIRDFVKQGGAYLGLCAGAYYASNSVCFGRDTPLHVEGERELGFFPGTAFGSVARAFDYTSEAGAQHRSIHLSIREQCALAVLSNNVHQATPVTICAPMFSQDCRQLEQFREGCPSPIPSAQQDSVAADVHARHKTHPESVHSESGASFPVVSQSSEFGQTADVQSRTRACLGAVAACSSAAVGEENGKHRRGAAMELSQHNGSGLRLEENVQAAGAEWSSAVLQEDIWLDGPSDTAREQQSCCFLPEHPHGTGQSLESSQAAILEGPVTHAALFGSQKKFERGELLEDSIARAGIRDKAAVVNKVSEQGVEEVDFRNDATNGKMQKQLEWRAALLRSENGPSSSCELQKGSFLVDYVNGGCCFLFDVPGRAPKEDEGSADFRDGITVVARYQQTARIAAVATRPFGEHAGRAVLCGTHPEMPGDVLLAGVHLEPPNSVKGGLGAAWYRQHLMQLHERLLGSGSDKRGENERRREMYFRLLLQHAGLQKFLTVF